MLKNALSSLDGYGRQFLILLAATLVLLGIAAPANAAQVHSGRITSATCYTSYCAVYVYTTSGSVLTRPLTNALIWDCTEYGVPQGALISNSRLTTLKNAKAWLTVVWYSAPGYRDSITCT